MTQLYIPTLDIQPLDKAVFAPFGTVIETDGAKQISINQGTTTRFDAMSAVDVKEAGGQPVISLFRGNRRPDPIEIHLLERHPLGSQAFMPLSQHDWLVVVAHANAADDAVPVGVIAAPPVCKNPISTPQRNPFLASTPKPTPR